MNKFSQKKYFIVIFVVIGIFVIMLAGFKIALGTEKPFYIVSSGSMIPTLDVYDVIMVQENFPFDHIKIGDVIAFKSPSGTNEIIVHRVAQVLNQDPLVIRTKGDANRDSIPGTDLPITKDDYIGKVAYVIPKFGYVTHAFIFPMNYLIMSAIMGVVAIKPIYRKK